MNPRFLFATLAAGAGAAMLGWRLYSKFNQGASTVEQSIEVDVPLRTAYNQWTQFEDFPRFMEGVREVRQTDDSHLHWHAQIGGKEVQWDAEITDQTPDQRIAWRSTSGPRNDGAVSFHPLSDSKTRVVVRMNYEPADALEKVGDALGAVALRVKGDLERYKNFLESRGKETGEWRGSIHGS